MGPTTAERVLGCVRDYLEGAQSRILRCALAGVQTLPENHEKKPSSTTHIKNIERETDTMAHYSAVRNAIRDYMNNGLRKKCMRYLHRRD